MGPYEMMTHLLLDLGENGSRSLHLELVGNLARTLVDGCSGLFGTGLFRKRMDLVSSQLVRKHSSGNQPLARFSKSLSKTNA